MKKIQLRKPRKAALQTPFAFLGGLFTVDGEAVRKTVPTSLLKQNMFCSSVHRDEQDFPFDPDTRSIINRVSECERISLDDAIATLEGGRAGGLGIVLRQEDGLCAVILKTDTYFQQNDLPDEVAAIISNLNTHTVFGLGGKTITILCEAVKPKDFLDSGVLADGTEIVVLDRDCFVSLSGMAFREEQDIFNRQAEIVKLCEDYVDPRCPIVGWDGALKGIVPAVFSYTDRRGDFHADWSRRVAKHKRVRNRVLPPEFVASVEMLAHLMGVGE
jgi:hypothetical protein